MAPHQQRVIDEKTELDEKISKLSTFKTTEIYNGLDADEKERLTRQLSCMEEYSEILDERIAAFTPPASTNASEPGDGPGDPSNPGGPH